jgi:hypothetical protein
MKMKNPESILCRTHVNLRTFILLIFVLGSIFSFLEINENNYVFIILIGLVFISIAWYFSQFLIRYCTFKQEVIEITYPTRIRNRKIRFDYKEILSVSYKNTISQYSDPTITIHLNGKRISFPTGYRKNRKKIFEVIRNKSIELSIDSVLDGDYKI